MHTRARAHINILIIFNIIFIYIFRNFENLDTKAFMRPYENKMSVYENKMSVYENKNKMVVLIKVLLYYKNTYRERCSYE